MDQKTKIHAEDGKQEIMITRGFDLPLDLLFRAYVEPEIIEEWMGTKVIKLESKKYGSYEFQTTGPTGYTFALTGVIHEFIPNQKIIRTFEMSNVNLGVQLEFLEFEQLTEDTSKLTMHVIYESIEKRNQLLQLPFAKGINMAHNRMQEILNKLKNIKQ